MGIDDYPLTWLTLDLNVRRFAVTQVQRQLHADRGLRSYARSVARDCTFSMTDDPISETVVLGLVSENI